MKKNLYFVIFVVALMLPGVFALDFSQPISSSDQSTFDQILVPVMKIYNFIKYAATVIAVIVITFAGINYMTGGDDPKKRENAKSMATYVVIGLFVIWAAPLIVNFIVG
mgnify:CR=1 FL=1